MVTTLFISPYNLTSKRHCIGSRPLRMRSMTSSTLMRLSLTRISTSCSHRAKISSIIGSDSKYLSFWFFHLSSCRNLVLNMPNPSGLEPSQTIEFSSSIRFHPLSYCHKNLSPFNKTSDLRSLWFLYSLIFNHSLSRFCFAKIGCTAINLMIYNGPPYYFYTPIYTTTTVQTKYCS